MLHVRVSDEELPEILTVVSQEELLLPDDILPEQLRELDQERLVENNDTVLHD